MSGLLLALSPILKVIMEVLANVFKGLITTPVTIEVIEPDAGITVNPSDNDIIDQHGWLLDRAKGKGCLQ